MVIIGLAGQVCAGKSAVADAFRRRGAQLYDADKAVHEIYRQPQVIDQVRVFFGEGVLNSRGEVDRKALGNVVFSDAAKLNILTSQVIFPRTEISIRESISAAKASCAPAIVLDAPTLFEAGRDKDCDRVIFVSAPIERRREWARNRGWSEGDLERRDARMGDERTKRQRADAVIDNSGTLEDADRTVGALFEKWIQVK